MEAQITQLYQKYQWPYYTVHNICQPSFKQALKVDRMGNKLNLFKEF